ncbi:MAG: peptidase T [Halanaerobiales bacterium]|jgi:tripeptide aminopeptidase|nr:peptidase T [Halanaerobiales bacterium]HPZ63770.1 peptidase T [Halanaerobiales bacterium]HQD04412.1 peptidase T [Halanaerobiales bacterium]
MSKVVERFLKYVTYNTQSDEESSTVPSTEGQLVFARALKEELEAIGLKEVSLDEKGYLMATLESNLGEDKEVPTIGFIAHMDTSPDMSGENVKTQLIKNYDGGDIVLNEEEGIILSPLDFPELKDYVGRDIITTDGTTLLGADDKAGIAEIITAMEYLLENPEIKHGRIRIGFTPDEEIGRGADFFDVKKFAADLAYTVDGGPLGELEYENFNAAAARISIKGTSVHPGTAKGKMVNSLLIASELINKLPAEETPAETEGYEGFYHLVSVKGNVEETKLYYIIRDFDKINFIKRKTNLEEIVQDLNKKYDRARIQLKITDQYYNMKEIIENNKEIIDTAYQAMEEIGIRPLITPIRGGTDGARLSYMGLPTPNIFTGGHNFHGKYEFIPVFAMEKAVELIVKIAELYGQKGR